MRKKKEIGLEEMTLKDFIAIFAMSNVPDQSAYNMKPKESHEAYVSRRAYELADAMMEARNATS